MITSLVNCAIISGFFSFFLISKAVPFLLFFKTILFCNKGNYLSLPDASIWMSYMNEIFKLFWHFQQQNVAVLLIFHIAILCLRFLMMINMSQQLIKFCFVFHLDVLSALVFDVEIESLNRVQFQTKAVFVHFREISLGQTLNTTFWGMCGILRYKYFILLEQLWIVSYWLDLYGLSILLVV